MLVYFINTLNESSRNNSLLASFKYIFPCYYYSYQRVILRSNPREDKFEQDLVKAAKFSKDIVSR